MSDSTNDPIGEPFTPLEWELIRDALEVVNPETAAARGVRDRLIVRARVALGELGVGALLAEPSDYEIVDDEEVAWRDGNLERAKQALDDEQSVNDEPPPDVGPPGSGAIITEYVGNEPGLEDVIDEAIALGDLEDPADRADRIHDEARDNEALADLEDRATQDALIEEAELNQHDLGDEDEPRGAP